MDLTYPAEPEAFGDRIRATLNDQFPADWTGIGALPGDERTL